MMYNQYAYTHLICRGGCAKVHHFSRRQEAQIVKELEDFAGWLMDRQHNCHSIFTGEFYYSVNDEIGSCTVESASRFVKEKELWSLYELNANAYSPLLAIAEALSPPLTYSGVHRLLKPHLPYGTLRHLPFLSFRHC